MTTELKIVTLDKTIKERQKKFKERIETHINQNIAKDDFTGSKKAETQYHYNKRRQ